MIGVDTNVLVRVLVQDDQHQTDLAVAFLAERTSDDPAYVSAVVLAELVWTLKESYDFDRSGVHTALTSLFESSNVRIEGEEIMSAAIEVAWSNKADVADSIIVALARDAGAASTVTFDRPAAQRIPGMELLK